MNVTSNLQQQLSVVENLTVKNGIYIWKVAGVSKLLESPSLNESIYSPCFFTHEKGYKLQLRLDPGGFGEGKGTHMTLFVRICNGPNDDNLTWPFHHGITLEVLDLTGGGHHTTCALPAGALGPIYWKKPCGAPNASIGHGQCLSHSDLKKQDFPCLLDDSLYIRVDLGKW